MLRRWIRITPVLLALLLSLVGVGTAQGGINVLVDNTPVTFDQPPVVMGGSVMVPMRGVFERLGADVVWVPASQTIRATHGDTTIELKLGAASATINGQAHPLTTPAMSVGGRTMVPLRFVSEAMGADVRWSPASRTVAITTNAGPPQGQAPPPYPNQTPPVAQGPNIASVMTNFNGPLHPGQSIGVTLQGDPGGQASFDVTGVFNNVPMSEQAPGRYVGSVQIPYNANAANAQIIGHLSNGRGQSTLAATPAAPPEPPPMAIGFARISPTEEAAVRNPRPNVLASLASGSLLVPSSVRLLVNGRDVTSQATVAQDFISWVPSTDLPPGRVTVFVSAADAQGNRLQKEWAFNVEAPVSVIRRVFHNGEQPLVPGNVLTVTMEAEPGGRAWFNIEHFREHIPMAEVAPGRYVGTYQVQPGDQAHADVIAHLEVPGQPEARKEAGRPVTIGLAEGGPPNFGGLQLTSPTPGMPVSDAFIIAGTTMPGGSVQLVVTVVQGQYNSQAVLNTQVTAGANGYFQYDFIMQGHPPFRGGEFIVSATPVVNGQFGQAVTVQAPRQ